MRASRAVRAVAGRLAALAVVAALLAGCGDDANFIRGEDSERLNAPVPEAPGEMRAELASIADTLDAASWRPGQPGSDRHAVACARLFDLADALRFKATRYDLEDIAYERVADANRACDERPQEAAGLVKQALQRP